MSTERDTTTLDHYIQGTLSDEEREAVASRIANDSEFRALYAFTLSVKSATERVEGQRIKAMLRGVSLEDAPGEEEGAPDTVAELPGGRVVPFDTKEVERASGRTTTPRMVAWRWGAPLGIAASLLLLLIVQPTRRSNEEIFASYGAETTHSIPSVLLDRNPASDSPETGTRGAETLLAGFTAGEMAKLTEAFQLLDAQEFERARPILRELINDKGELPLLLFALAIANLNTNQVEPAVNALEQLSSRRGLPFKEDVDYTLALGYIKSDQLGKARPLLNSLKASSPKYAASAEAILGKLRWF